jgi:hypothetical protein
VQWEAAGPDVELKIKRCKYSGFSMLRKLARHGPLREDDFVVRRWRRDIGDGEVKSS